MRVGYLLNQYPAVSHTFIRREILALESSGTKVVRFSIRGWNLPIADPIDIEERKKTRFVLRVGLATITFSFFRLLVTRPRAVLRAVILMYRSSRRSERPFPAHLAWLLEACQLFFWCESEKVEHIHAHFATNASNVAMLLHTLGGPTWSFTVHGMATLENPAYVNMTEKIKRCSFVVAICSFARGQLFRFTDRSLWHKVKEVHCGLEPAFYNFGLEPLPRTPRLVCVGRLTEAKGQTILLDALQILASEGHKFELVFGGDGELRHALERIISDYGLNSNVRITGWISSDEVRREILSARALVLPSLAEGLPVVIMEAMALERPVISTYVAGIPELVRSGQEGWLVPAGDVAALADALRECITAPVEQLVKMGRQARSRAIERHDINAEAAKLRQLFEDSTQRRPRIA